MRPRFPILAALACVLAIPAATSAGACYSDPVYDAAGTVTVTADARIRSAACSAGTSVLFAAKKGARLELTGRTDGWYRVRDAQGRGGWVWDGLAKVTSDAVPDFAYAPTAQDAALLAKIRPLLEARPSGWLTSAAAKLDALAARSSNPRNTYVLGKLAADARQVVAARAAQDAAAAKAAAKPAPSAPAVTSSHNPAPSAPVASPVTPSTDTPDPAPEPSVIPSTASSWGIPRVDESRVRAAWLGWYNDARADLGLHAYAYDARLDATALEWSGVAKSRGQISHKRDPKDPAFYNYAAVTSWFKDRGLVFKNVNRVTHTENIGFGYFRCPASGDCTDALIAGIRDTFDFYMAERFKTNAWERAHYTSVVNARFQIVGLGIVADGNKYYLTVHYGTSVLP